MSCFICHFFLPQHPTPDTVASIVSVLLIWIMRPKHNRLHNAALALHDLCVDIDDLGTIHDEKTWHNLGAFLPYGLWFHYACYKCIYIYIYTHTRAYGTGFEGESAKRVLHSVAVQDAQCSTLFVFWSAAVCVCVLRTALARLRHTHWVQHGLLSEYRATDSFHIAGKCGAMWRCQTAAWVAAILRNCCAHCAAVHTRPTHTCQALVYHVFFLCVFVFARAVFGKNYIRQFV